MGENVIEVGPITRIEGHARVDVILDDSGTPVEARFKVLEFRGFEKFLEGTPIEEMPALTARICGVCPVAHHLASAKTVDKAFGVEIPEAARLLRELMYMGHMIHSHALHFFVLMAPDIVLRDSPPEKRNLIGLKEAAPDVVKKAMKLIVDQMKSLRIRPKMLKIRDERGSYLYLITRDAGSERIYILLETRIDLGLEESSLISDIESLDIRGLVRKEIAGKRGIVHRIKRALGFGYIIGSRISHRIVHDAQAR